MHALSPAPNININRYGERPGTIISIFQWWKAYIYVYVSSLYGIPVQTSKQKSVRSRGDGDGGYSFLATSEEVGLGKLMREWP